MKQKSINFWKGEIKYWELSDIKEYQPIELQIDLLKEDLVQVYYSKENMYIDIWWYPSFNKDGYFILFLIKDNDWDNPIEKKSFQTIYELKNWISNIITKYWL